MKCPKQLSVTFSCREHGLLSGFSWFICAESSLEGCEHEVIPPEVTQMKMWRKFAKLCMINAVPFGMSERASLPEMCGMMVEPGLLS